MVSRSIYSLNLLIVLMFRSLQLQAGLYNQAQKSFREGLRYAPNYGKSFLLLGLSYLEYQVCLVEIVYMKTIVEFIPTIYNVYQ